MSCGISPLGQAAPPHSTELVLAQSIVKSFDIQPRHASSGAPSWLAVFSTDSTREQQDGVRNWLRTKPGGRWREAFIGAARVDEFKALDEASKQRKREETKKQEEQQVALAVAQAMAAQGNTPKLHGPAGGRHHHLQPRRRHREGGTTRLFFWKWAEARIARAPQACHERWSDFCGKAVTGKDVAKALFGEALEWDRLGQAYPDPTKIDPFGPTQDLCMCVTAPSAASPAFDKSYYAVVMFAQDGGCALQSAVDRCADSAGGRHMAATAILSYGTNSQGMGHSIHATSGMTAPMLAGSSMSVALHGQPLVVFDVPLRPPANQMHTPGTSANPAPPVEQDENWEAEVQAFAGWLDGHKDVSCVILELVCACNGFELPPAFARGIQQVCFEQRVLVVVDECYTGFRGGGDSVALCLSERYRMCPDAIVWGKLTMGVVMERFDMVPRQTHDFSPLAGAAPDRPFDEPRGALRHRALPAELHSHMLEDGKFAPAGRMAPPGSNDMFTQLWRELYEMVQNGWLVGGWEKSTHVGDVWCLRAQGVGLRAQEVGRTLATHVVGAMATAGVEGEAWWTGTMLYASHPVEVVPEWRARLLGTEHAASLCTSINHYGIRINPCLDIELPSVGPPETCGRSTQKRARQDTSSSTLGPVLRLFEPTDSEQRPLSATDKLLWRMAEVQRRTLLLGKQLTQCQ